MELAAVQRRAVLTAERGRAHRGGADGLSTAESCGGPWRARDPACALACHTLAKKLRQDAAELGKILRLFKDGVMLLDEVDLLLHPYVRFCICMG